MKVVLIAGRGRLPYEAAKSLSERGDEVVIVTFAEQSAEDFSKYSNEVVTLSLGQVGHVLRFLRKSGADALVFAGKIDKTLLEKNLKLDAKAILMLALMKDRQEDTIMNSIVREIEKLEIEILSQLDVLTHLVARNGVFSKKQPTKKQLEDIKFAYEKAKGIAALDIGQSIVVKNKTVLSVESLEGTNATIERGATLCNKDFTFLKVAKPKQDYRFDLPVIGYETFETFANNDGGVFAVEADFTLIMDYDRCVELANKNKFVFMAYGGGR